MILRSRSGQAMLEYVLAFAALLTVAAALAVLVRATWSYADRTEDLVTSDCP